MVGAFLIAIATQHAQAVANVTWRIGEHNKEVFALFAGISARLQRMETSLYERTCQSHTPPGLQHVTGSTQIKDHNQIEKRVELLENVYVLTDWEALETVADSMTVVSSSRASIEQSEGEKSLAETAWTT